MARMAFTAEDISQAKAGGKVLFVFAIDGTGCPGYPDRMLKFDGMLSPDQAEELTDIVRAKLKAFKSAG